MKDIIEKHMRITIEAALIARAEGENQKNIVGNILLEEGLKVFDNYFFVPQDERKSSRIGCFFTSYFFTIHYSLVK